MHKLVVLYPPPADKEKFRTPATRASTCRWPAKLPGLRAYAATPSTAGAPHGDSSVSAPCIFEA